MWFSFQKNSFMNGEKLVAIISDAASTGMNIASKRQCQANALGAYFRLGVILRAAQFC